MIHTKVRGDSLQTDQRRVLPLHAHWAWNTFLVSFNYTKSRWRLTEPSIHPEIIHYKSFSVRLDVPVCQTCVHSWVWTLSCVVRSHSNTWKHTGVCPSYSLSARLLSQPHQRQDALKTHSSDTTTHWGDQWGLLVLVLARVSVITPQNAHYK